MPRTDRRDNCGRAAVGAVSFSERPLLFDCEGERLVGMLALPEKPSRVAVIVVVGGPQYRAGAHRQFVQLSRRLAEAGFPALRFDYRGMGDSSGMPRTFEECGPDIAAVGGERRARQGPGETRGRTRLAKGADGVDADQVLAGAVAHDRLRVPEERVEDLDPVVHEGVLVAKEDFAQLVEDVGQVDLGLHVVEARAATGAWATPADSR